MKRVLALVVAGLLPAVAFAQEAPKKITVTSGFQYQYGILKRNLKEAQEKMPQADYGFKPKPGMRAFGELFGHLANAQFVSCATLKGEPNPNQGNDAERKTTKAEFVKDLSDSFAYCDDAFAAATDDTMTKLVKQGQNEVTRGFIMMDLIRHDWNMLGTVVTYLQLKGIQPPHER